MMAEEQKEMLGTAAGETGGTPVSAAKAQEEPHAGQAASQENGEEMTIEQAFQRLQQILTSMEKEGTSLEDSFRQYEEGMKLVQLCSSKIDRVEKKVQMMNVDGTMTNFEDES